MPTFPPPATNPYCRCPTPRDMAVCTTGHVTECHYPYTCPAAACGHLWLSVPGPERIAELQRLALDTLRDDPRYGLADRGQIVVLVDAMRRAVQE